MMDCPEHYKCRRWDNLLGYHYLSERGKRIDYASSLKQPKTIVKGQNEEVMKANLPDFLL